MPRRVRVSGRVERRNRRDSMRSLRVVIANPSNESDPQNLVDSYKVALVYPIRDFVSHKCGSLNLCCSLCGAKHFQSEVTRRNTQAFTSCCHKGKVNLPPLTQNRFFQSLCEGLYSTDVAIKRRSKNYFQNIRSYNSSFAMVSSEAKLSDTAFNGVYHFKIHDIFYHRAGALTPIYGRPPIYAQLYFFDVDTAVQHRMRVSANQGCHVDLMRELGVELDRVNSFIRSFRSMAEFCRQPENSAADVCMVIKVNHNTDLRRFNDAVHTDVAAIFKNDDGEPPFERNMVVFSKLSNSVRSISVLDSSLDPLAYPLLFPNGDTGWHVNMAHNIPSTSSTVSRNKITMLQYASYRLAIRDEFSILHCSQKLFLQWVVDMYVRIEGSRLHFVRQNQAALRAELYNNLTDFVQQNPNGVDGVHGVGRKIILPSSFTGSPRNMFQNYLDAMSIVQHFGKPSLFVTMTCNPSWPEIVEVLGGANANFRPDVVVRVFKSKLRELIDSIVKRHIFGKVEAIIYTIEFQKRGLPHAHVLITLNSDDKIDGIASIDQFVCAEIPDICCHPKLHKLVKQHMIHGPCGLLNPNSVCMRDGKCTKNFPKDFCDNTRDSVNGYPVYKRRDNGANIDVRGHSVDNRYVVPYNPYLLAKFDCHLNVEVCTTVKSVKYIYKYVYKGYDCASLEFGVVNGDVNGGIQIDEIQNFLNGRFVGSTEAAWRIFEYPLHFQSHTIIRLDCHLPNRQNVVFREGTERQAVANPSRTKLLAFFELNRNDLSANDLIYTQIPLYYVWNDSRKCWTKRQRGGDKIISRLYVVSPKDIELFHLRLLLLHVRGPQSFDDLRRYDSINHLTFVDACHARGIASNDSEWRECLNEAKETKSPRQLRQLFGFICGLNVPANASALWDEFKMFMSEDFLRDCSVEISYNRSLLEIEDILLTHNLSCQQLGLPNPIYVSDNVDLDHFDPDDEAFLFSEMYERANSEQRNIIDSILREVLYHDTGSNVFCLTAHAGCGKTFVQTAIIHKLNSLNLRCIATAFSGIASTLLIGGRTLHNVFKLPIPILENSVSSVTANSAQGQYIHSAALILIDEAFMCPLHGMKLIERLLRDLSVNANRNKLFGGKTIFLSGDPRQILPVVPHGSRVTIIENSITSWPEFSTFHHVNLTQNMRALPHELEFVDFLKSIGNGDRTTFPQFNDNIIEIPTHLYSPPENVIQDMFGDISETILSSEVLESVILAPKNDDCTFVNSEILSRMQGEEKAYFSFDKIICDDEREQNNYPVEFLNSLTVSGLPPHKLVLKENCIVLLIRNLNTKNALVNGTRMRVKQMHRNSIDCQVLTGVARNTRILIPRIHLTHSGTLLPFSFQRTQFPVIPAFAMTINKSQGQTFQKVGILLRQPVFTHGQLYVAASRVRSFDGLRFYITETSDQGHLSNDHRVFTKNIVYKEVIGP